MSQGQVTWCQDPHLVLLTLSGFVGGGEIVSETESEAMCKEEKDSETRERMQMQVLSRLQYANTVAFVICKWEITER